MRSLDYLCSAWAGVHTALAVTRVIVSNGDGPALAAINGTILAIAIAAISGYLLLVFQTTDRMETEIIDHADRVVGTGPTNVFYPTSVLRTDDLSVDDLLDVLVHLGRGLYGERWHLPPPSDQASRGEALIAAALALARSYPFADAPRGKRDLQTVRGVRVWLADADPRVTEVFHLTTDRADALRHLAAALDSQIDSTLVQPLRAAGIAPHSLPTSMQMGGGLGRILQDFVTWVASFHAVIVQVKADLDRLERYRGRRLPRRWPAVAGVVAVLTVFVCGVAWPMIWPDAPRVVSAWVPLPTYASGLVFGAFLVIKRYKGPWRG